VLNQLLDLLDFRLQVAHALVSFTSSFDGLDDSGSLHSHLLFVACEFGCLRPHSHGLDGLLDLMFLVFVSSADRFNDGVGQVDKVTVDSLTSLLLVLTTGPEEDGEDVSSLQTLEGLD